jgi:hypothetical protein
MRSFFVLPHPFIPSPKKGEGEVPEIYSTFTLLHPSPFLGEGLGVRC